MDDHNDLFVCSLSGVEASEIEVLPDDLADDLGLLPVGWTRLVIERRLPNPDWQEVQQVKHMMVEAARQQLPEDQQVPEAIRALQIQVAAQYASLEEPRHTIRGGLVQFHAYEQSPTSDGQHMRILPQPRAQALLYRLAFRPYA